MLYERGCAREEKYSINEAVLLFFILIRHIGNLHTLLYYITYASLLCAHTDSSAYQHASTYIII